MQQGKSTSPISSNLKSHRNHRRFDTLTTNNTFSNLLTSPPLKMLMTSQAPSMFKVASKRLDTEENAGKNTENEFHFGQKKTQRQNLEVKQEDLSMSTRSKSLASLSMNKVATARRNLKPSANNTPRKPLQPSIPNQQDIILEKEKENEELKQQISKLMNSNKTISLKHMNNTTETESQNINLVNSHNEELFTSNDIFKFSTIKAQEILKVLAERCMRVSALANSLEQGLIKGITDANLSSIKLTMEELVVSLVNASKTEIELGIKIRENEKKALEIAKQKVIYEKIQTSHKHLQMENEEMRRHRQDLNLKIFSLEKQLLTEKNINAENSKKIETFEKRIELILEADLGSDKDKLRKAFTELVKENDNLKRALDQKTKESNKKSADITNIQSKVTRLNKRIDSLTRNKRTIQGIPLTKEDQDLLAKVDGEKGTGRTPHETISMLNGDIPNTLDFRMNSLKANHHELLTDLFDKGSASFVTHFTSLNDTGYKKELLTFVVNELINNREFGDKLHFLFKESLMLINLQEVWEIQMLLNKHFKYIFNANTVNLWVPDGMTGIFYTRNVGGEELRCLATKGLINEVLKSKRAYNRALLDKNFVCELASREGKYKPVNTMLVPLKRPNGNVVAILEVSENPDTYFGFDDEYFALVLSQVILFAMEKVTAIKTLKEEHRIKDTIVETFAKLTGCHNKFEFTNTVIKYTNKALRASNCNFILVENGKLVKYTSEKQSNTYDFTIGVSGQVCQERKGKIILDMSACQEFNSIVDVYSLTPIYFTPVIAKNDKGNEVIVGILQLGMKSKVSRPKPQFEELDDVIENIGIDEPMENLANIFSDLIGNSLLHQKNFAFDI